MLGQKPEDDTAAADGAATEDEGAAAEAEPAAGSDQRPKRDLKKIN